MTNKKHSNKKSPFKVAAHFKLESAGHWTCALCESNAFNNLPTSAALAHERTRAHQRKVEDVTRPQLEPEPSSNYWSWSEYDDSQWYTPWKRQFDAVKDMIPFWRLSMQAEEQGGEPVRLIDFLDDVQDPWESDDEHESADGWGKADGVTNVWGRQEPARDGWGRPEPATDGWGRPEAHDSGWGNAVGDWNAKQEEVGDWGKPATWARSSVSSDRASHVNSAASAKDLPSAHWDAPSDKQLAPASAPSPVKEPQRSWAQVARQQPGREQRLNAFKEMPTSAKVKKIEETARNLRRTAT